MEKKAIVKTSQISQLEKDNLILREKLKQFELKEEKIELEKRLVQEEANTKEATEKIKRNKLVSGVFDFRQVPDGNLKFDYKKYKGEPREKYSLKDKVRYALKMKIAQHLIETGMYYAKEEGMFEVGKPAREVKMKRYNFIIDAFPDPAEDISKLPTGELKYG